MQFEDLDNKVKEAAEQHHPAYDEKAWVKMEKLLNKHLPQEKDNRRRVLFILLLFLFVGGGVFIGINKPWQRNSVAQNKPEQIVGKTGQPGNTTTGNKDHEATSPQNNNNKITINGSVENTNKETAAGIHSEQDVFLQKRSPAKEKTTRGNDQTPSVTKAVAGINKNPEITGQENKAGNNVNKAGDPSSDRNNNSVVNNKVAETSANKEETINKPESKEKNDVRTDDVTKAPTTTNKTPKTRRAGASNGFALNFSAGPDVSQAGSSKPGTTKLAYGAGISYTRNRFTLKTGVYTGKKIYKATEKEYTLSYSLPPNIKFTGADADCKVIEIPLNINYRFNITPKSNWFAGTGLSTYLMKRETYTYHYKNTLGSTYNHTYEFKNENKHYFSVLNLSAGYTRQLSQTFSITAEPYFKIPLQGIGEGKVHLNSGGILFTAGIHPFNHKTKNK